MTPWWVSLLISLGMAVGGSVVALLVAEGIIRTKLEAQEREYTTANLALEKLLSQRANDIERMALRRFEVLENDTGRAAQDLRDAARELHEVATELTALAREQAVTNTMMAKTMESHESTLQKHSTEIEELRIRAHSIQRQAYEHAGEHKA